MNTEIQEFDIVMGKDPKTPFSENAKEFSIRKGQRVLFRFPFEFKVLKTGATEFRNLKTPMGKIDGLMFQIINEDRNQQITLKVPYECMETGKLIEENGNYFLSIKEEYQVGLHPKLSNILLCKKSN